MTDTERARISGQEEVEDIKRYQAISRVRNRIQEELTKDIEALKDHHPDLLEELREVVCEPSPSESDEGGGRSESEAEAYRSGAPESASKSIDNELMDTVPTPLSDISVPGSGQLEIARIRAVVIAYSYIRQEGSATTGEIRDHVVDEVGLLGYQTAQSMWKNCIYKGLLQLADRDEDLHTPGPGEKTWHYAGPKGIPFTH